MNYFALLTVAMVWRWRLSIERCAAAATIIESMTSQKVLLNLAWVCQYELVLQPYHSGAS
jgi:hypothetical protein